MRTVHISDGGAAEAGRALAAIPSPSVSGIELGPVTIHFYALCILAGVIAAVAWSERRWTRLGGQPGTIMDVAIWAVPAGLIGGRLYHVISDYQLYFGPNSPNDAIVALYIWRGGLGIWGAIALGAVAVWVVARSRGLSMTKLSFAVVPGLALAQGIGRWGNWFNQELFGAPTDLPWGVRIDPGMPDTIPGESVYHPTFLYESLWCIALAFALAWLGNRFYDQLQGGRLFAVYLMGYTLGRFWIEYLRIDEANMILGFRLNNWTAVLVFLVALAYFVWAGTRKEHFSDRVRPKESDDAAVPAPARKGAAVDGEHADATATADDGSAVRGGADDGDQPVDSRDATSAPSDAAEPDPAPENGRRDDA